VRVEACRSRALWFPAKYGGNARCARRGGTLREQIQQPETDVYYDRHSQKHLQPPSAIRNPVWRLPQQQCQPVSTLNLKGNEEGVLAACRGGVYTLFNADHKLHYDYNYFKIARYSIVFPPLPTGKVDLNSISSKPECSKAPVSCT
jgi:hypothetical protein